MLIDCDTCTAGPSACGDCIVTHLLSSPGRHGRPPETAGRPSPTELQAGTLEAVGVLAAGGLVPPLRLITPPPQGVAGDQGARVADPQRPPEGLGTGARAG